MLCYKAQHILCVVHVCVFLNLLSSLIWMKVMGRGVFAPNIVFRHSPLKQTCKQTQTLLDFVLSI